MGVGDRIRERAVDGCVFCAFMLALGKGLVAEERVGGVWFDGEVLQRDGERILELVLRDDTGDESPWDRPRMAVSVQDVAGADVVEAGYGNGPLEVHYDENDHPIYGPTPGGATIIPPLVRTRVDWSRVGGWVQKCCSDHPQCKPRDDLSFPPNFRLIDVEERRVVRSKNPPPRFLALSYVWGRAPNQKATRANINQLYLTRALDAFDLPPAIRDAMSACRGLRERYLWVDLLCIIQDDPGDKQEQIASMAAIYSAAAYALVIASGESMADEIAGISRARAEQPRITTQHLMFTQAGGASPDDELLKSKWATRGWTFQEWILPSRKLYIMDREVWFECNIHAVRENASSSSWGEVRNKRSLSWNGGLLNARRRGSGLTWTMYCEHLESYSRRQLTNFGDTYDAFEGIMQGLYGDKGCSFFGLPIVSFDSALLWSPHKEKGPVFTNEDDSGFPTWSWGSSRSEITMEWLPREVNPLVLWYRYSKNTGKLEEIPYECSARDESEEYLFYRRSYSRTCYISLAWQLGCLEQAFPFSKEVTTTIEDLDKASTSRWPTYGDCLEEALRDPNCSASVHELLKKAYCSRSAVREPVGVLFTRAQSAFFKVKAMPIPTQFNLGIWTSEGQIAGFLQRPDNTQVLERFCQKNQDGDLVCEFIAISMSCMNLNNGSNVTELVSPATRDAKTPRGDLHTIDWQMQLIATREYDLTFFDGKGSALNPIPIVNVLLIGSDTDGFTFRIGLGWITLTKWVKSRRTFKDIALR